MAEPVTIPGVTVRGKLYHTGNCNDYQLVLLRVIAEQQALLEALQKQGASKEARTKQLGVVEHYCSMLPDFEGVQKVEHLWDKGGPAEKT